MNICSFMGRLVKEPVNSSKNEGKCYLTGSLAVEYYDNKEKKTDFINYNCGGGVAKTIINYCSKGSQVILCGSLHSNNYTDTNGVAHYGMALSVEKFYFTGNNNKKNSNEATNNPFKDLPNIENAEENIVLANEDLPF